MLKHSRFAMLGILCGAAAGMCLSGAGKADAADSEVVVLSFASNGSNLFAILENGCIRVWDAKTLAKPREKQLPLGTYGPVRISPDGRLVAGDVWSEKEQTRKVAVFEVATGELLGRFEEKVESGWSLEFSPNGELVAVEAGPANRRNISLRKPTTGELVRQLTSVGYYRVIFTFSPGSRILASSYVYPEGTHQGESGIALWSANTGKRLCVLTGADSEVRGLKFRGDGKAICAITMPFADRPCLYTWDIPASGCKEGIRPKSQYFMGDVRFSADIAAKTFNTMVWISSHFVPYACEFGTTEIRAYFVSNSEGRGSRGTIIAVSPDGGLVAYGTAQGEVWVWNTQTRKLEGPL